MPTITLGTKHSPHRGGGGLPFPRRWGASFSSAAPLSAKSLLSIGSDGSPGGPHPSRPGVRWPGNSSNSFAPEGGGGADSDSDQPQNKKSAIFVPLDRCFLCAEFSQAVRRCVNYRSCKKTHGKCTSIICIFIINIGATACIFAERDMHICMVRMSTLFCGCRDTEIHGGFS